VLFPYPDAAERSRRPMITQPNILVVDDEPSMLRYMQTLLESDNYRVETAANGNEALRRMEQNPGPDLVLLDLLMPNMDGLQTLERVRQDRKSTRLNSSHRTISYAVFCLKKKKKQIR